MARLPTLGSRMAEDSHNEPAPARRTLRLQWRFFQCGIWSRNATMRVSYSAILRVRQEDRYLLIENIHRRGSYGPIGGVYKRLAASDLSLDPLEFLPHSVTREMAADIRGFIPRHRMRAFDDWFRLMRARESVTECLRRELDE